MDTSKDSAFNVSKASRSIPISTLPLDAWSVCLQYLPPPNMSIASSCLCKELSVDNAREQAAWSTLMDIFSKASGRAVMLDRYPQETWQELYAICWSLLKGIRKAQVAKSVNNDANQQYTGLHGANTKNGETAIHLNEMRKTVFWLIFGYDEFLSSCTTTTSYVDIMTRLWCEKVKENDREWKAHYRARIQSTAVRLKDIGKWDSASSLLSSLVDDAESSLLEDGQEVVGHLSQRDNAEINICISTFLIDQLYASTYVRKSATDSEQLSDAVTCGRTAISLCLQSQNSITVIDGAEQNSKFTASSSLPLALDPPPPISLYSSDFIRLAASRLALGRSCALLAQHIGLNMTQKEDVLVRPSSYNVGFSAKAFFQEGEYILKASIIDLTLAQKTDDSFVLLEMLAATYAALGELYYCSSCVNHSISLLKDSIRYLSSSLRLVHKKLIGDHGIKPNIRALCSESPRSLMLLQAQTAKDLGKVYTFAERFLNMNSSLIEPKILCFALIVSMYYYNDDHPSIMNIKRLAQHTVNSPTIQGTKADLEKEVNQMLINNFLPE